jgi:2-C-methyl-D-erythritol 2,4-cyclodiphosphate synthase
MVNFSKLRIGSGYDLHPISDDPTRKFYLGGVEISSGSGPMGHSDADVVCHAIADAILGLVGLGGIGDHFLASDPQWKDAKSTLMLARCLDMVTDRGAYVIHVDVTVILQTPWISPYRSMIEGSLSELLKVPVSLKAKSPEHVGSLGRNEAVVAQAVALGYLNP